MAQNKAIVPGILPHRRVLISLHKGNIRRCGGENSSRFHICGAAYLMLGQCSVKMPHLASRMQTDALPTPGLVLTGQPHDAATRLPHRVWIYPLLHDSLALAPAK